MSKNNEYIRNLNFTTFSIYERVKNKKKLNLVPVNEVTQRRLFKQLFHDAYIHQNYILSKALEFGWTPTNGKFNNFRELPSVEPEMIDKYTNKHNTNEIAQREVSRILKVHTQRLEIAKFMESQNWDISYSKVKEHFDFDFLNYNLYKNILRSESIPKIESIDNPKIMVSYTNTAFCTKPMIVEEYLIIELISLVDKKYSLFFKIPSKIVSDLKKDLLKVSRPEISISKQGKLIFGFSFFYEKKEKITDNKTFLGIDLGVIRPIVGTLVKDCKIVNEYKESIHSDRHLKKLDKLYIEKSRINEKKKRKYKLGADVSVLEKEIEFLGKKIIRVKDSLFWQIASDVCRSVDKGTTVVIENLSWVTGGGRYKWKSGDFRKKLEHIAEKEGVNVVKVSAKNTSQKCCVCNEKMEIDIKTRVVTCCNGHNFDRDTNASRNITKRKTEIKNPNKQTKTLRLQPKKKKFAYLEPVYFYEILTLVCADFTGSVATFCSLNLGLDRNGLNEDLNTSLKTSQITKFEQVFG